MPEGSTEACADGGCSGEVGLGCQTSGRPGDVTMAGGVVKVVAVREDPALANKVFAQSAEIGGDIEIGTRESFFGNGKLVHEGETDVVLFRIHMFD